jgi:sucrose phosphorylase
MDKEKKIKNRLEKIYKNSSEYLFSKILEKINEFNSKMAKKEKYVLDEKKSVLIAYGDSIKNNGNSLETLENFMKLFVGDSINTIHILPFFPYSSDDGFSVIDYKKVNPDLGDWQNIKNLSKSYYLMFDAVINHISSKSDWFKAFLNGEDKYKDYFIVENPEVDLSKVTRPRVFPLLSKYETKNGLKYVWTTFSDDQIDLNYKNPELLLDIIDILLFYVSNGATLLRLDAIGYLWKKVGSNCIHLEETHEIIKLFKDIFDLLNRKVIIITETNVPHKENISYFGNGNDEAQMVYNFSLAPLILNAFQAHSSKNISKWIRSLEYPSEETTFFNFLASHDGIGLLPVKDILDEKEINILIEKVKKNNGKISYKKNSDGTNSPYEMNINYFDALYDSTESEEQNIRKFLGAYFIAFSLRGVPGIYIHSLIGSRNWKEGVEKQKHNRAINREKINYEHLLKELSDKKSFRHKIFTNMKEMLEIRKNYKSFSPVSEQEILDSEEGILVIKRINKDEKIYCIINLTPDRKILNLSSVNLFEESVNLLNNEIIKEILKLESYEYVWLKI